ncbi:MAG: chromate efflux transporter [Bacteroidota bacterium]
MKELCLLFLKLGTIAFGGPAAHIAMMEDEVVKRRQWLTPEQFMDLLGITNLIPGPNSTELAIQIGYIRAGWKGLIIAGVCFIVPSIILTLVLVHLYILFGALPQMQGFIFGIRPAVIAIILTAAYRLGKPMMKNMFKLVMIVAVVAGDLLHVDEVVLLFGAGVVGMLWTNRAKLNAAFALAPLGTLLWMQPARSALVENAPTLAGLALVFLKIGSVLYGGGYVLVAFLQRELVDSRHWLTLSQLLDAVSAGQFTPGPLLSTVTFIGYIMLGFPGALAATTAVFLPSFIFVRIVSPFIPRLRNSLLASGFLDGVNAAALGLIIAVGISLAASGLHSFSTWAIFCVAFIVSVLWKPNAAWIVLGSGILGWLFSFSPI